MKTSKFFQPNESIKHYLFNMKDSVFETLYSGFLFDLRDYSLRHYAGMYNIQTFEDISSYNSFLFRKLLIDTQSSDGDTLLDQVTNYFTKHPLHSNIFNAISKYLKGLSDMDFSFVK